MHCPQCSKTETKVIDSRLQPDGHSVRRRRRCESCDFRFTTYESYRPQMPAVVKNDGRRENFNREKIMSGLKKACQKRPISIDQLESLIDHVEENLCEGHPQEVDSQKIGPLVMQRLYELDPVSYVRFASFYWEYKDVADFVKNLENNSHPYLKPTQKIKPEAHS